MMARVRRSTPLGLSAMRLRNFKAIQDSKVIKFTPLTVLIGSNGSGKSSLIEGLMILQTIATEGLDEAMSRWHGFDYIWNKASRHTLTSDPTKGGIIIQTHCTFTSVALGKSLIIP